MFTWRFSSLFLASLCLLLVVSSEASARNITVSSKIKFYTITGSNAKDFAQSMSKKGPYSFQHRRRAWATAGRDLSFTITHKRSKGACQVQSAKVIMKITYTMPKLRAGTKIRTRERQKWQRMYALLDKHEKVHGAYYRQLASQVHKSLLRLKRARNCRQLERDALKRVKQLSGADTKRNNAFDVRDKGNYRRMERIYSRG